MQEVYSSLGVEIGVMPVRAGWLGGGKEMASGNHMGDDRILAEGFVGAGSIDEDEVGGAIDLETILVSNPEGVGSMLGDHGVAGVDFVEARHLAGVDSHAGDIEHVAGAEAVPGILDAVMAKAEVESGLPEFFDAGDAASFGVGIGAALEGDVDEGVGDEVELGFLEEAEEFEGVGVVVGTEGGGVAGGGAGAEAAAVGTGGEDFEEAGLLVVDFVAVEIDGAIVLLG